MHQENISFFPYVHGLQMRWTPDRAVRVRALAWVIVLCSWAKHF